MITGVGFGRGFDARGSPKCFWSGNRNVLVHFNAKCVCEQNIKFVN